MPAFQALIGLQHNSPTRYNSPTRFVSATHISPTDSTHTSGHSFSTTSNCHRELSREIFAQSQRPEPPFLEGSRAKVASQSSIYRCQFFLNVQHWAKSTSINYSLGDWIFNTWQRLPLTANVLITRFSTPGNVYLYQLTS